MILENVKDVITCKTRIIHIHTYINSYVKLYMIKIRFEIFTLGLGMKEWGRTNIINLIFCMKYKTKTSLLSMIPLIYLYHFNLHLYVQEEIQWCFIFRTWILIHLIYIFPDFSIEVSITKKGEYSIILLKTLNCWNCYHKNVWFEKQSQ